MKKKKEEKRDKYLIIQDNGNDIEVSTEKGTLEGTLLDILDDGPTWITFPRENITINMRNVSHIKHL